MYQGRCTTPGNSNEVGPQWRQARRGATPRPLKSSGAVSVCEAGELGALKEAVLEFWRGWRRARCGVSAVFDAQQLRDAHHLCRFLQEMHSGSYAAFVKMRVCFSQAAASSSALRSHSTQHSIAVRMAMQFAASIFPRRAPEPMSAAEDGTADKSCVVSRFA